MYFLFASRPTCPTSFHYGFVLVIFLLTVSCMFMLVFHFDQTKTSNYQCWYSLVLNRVPVVKFCSFEFEKF